MRQVTLGLPLLEQALDLGRPRQSATPFRARIAVPVLPTT